MPKAQEYASNGLRNPESWQVEITETGGLLTHLGKPRFIASWTTGLEDMSTLAGLFWTIEGSNEEDMITIHSFVWEESPSDQETFEELMHQAGIAIDHWITQQL